MPVDEEFLKTLPFSPGVYLMSDAKGRVLYVGKASNLRNRVRSYFVRGGDERPRIPFLMDRVDSVRTILTETEKEALILENNLIKQHRPKYNVDLRDDKSFFSLRLNVTHPFPRLTLVRTLKVTNDGERYFGPYSSATDARVTLKFIQQLFPLRQCTERGFETCTRPCLNCQMKRCLCPCAGYVEQAEYRRMVDAVIMLLSGKSEDLLKSLTREMHRASQDLRFEEAARLRDTISSVERTLEVQNVAFFHLKDQDVIASVKGEDHLHAVAVLSFRRGKLLNGDSFIIRNEALDEEEVLASAVKQFYADGAFVPKEILVCRPIEQPEPIAEWLSEIRGNKVIIRVPARGPGVNLMRLATKNARDALLRRRQRESFERSLDQIAARLHLPSAPMLIEGYDISNIAGSDPVGVKVAFKEARPYKKAYRHFKMQGFSDQDDPAMIHQTMVRRIRHRDEDPLPDLFLIDGGRAQLNAAVAALTEELGPDAPPVAAIAKVRQEGQQERIYLPHRKNPVVFPHGDSGLRLLMQVRDESHRVAQSFQSKRHKKAVIKSALDEVPGIGAKKREALLTAFGSVKKLLAASDAEIAQVPGVGLKDAQRIRQHLAEPSPEALANFDGFLHN
ncbi:MAG: excinuclease ABC subunit UvrC [Thermodesulfobacteriota bacterium]